MDKQTLTEFPVELDLLINKVERKRAYIASIRPSSLGAAHRFILRSLSRGENVNSVKMAAALNLNLEQASGQLEVLDSNDVISYKGGEVRSAYPFSAEKTRHQLLIGGNTAYALCAIDALGTPFMLGQDVAVDSSCPFCDAPINLQFEKGIWKAVPEATVVWIPMKRVIERAAEDICPYMDFFCDDKHSRDWQEKIGYEGVILDLQQATQLGKRFFGDFLRET